MMHAYATDTHERKTQIIALLAIASVSITALLDHLIESLPIVISAPAPLAVFGACYLIIDRYAWKWKIMQKMNATQTPDLSGKWAGEYRSSYFNYEKSQPLHVNISQTMSRISVRARFGESDSHSVTATLLSEGPQGVTLIYAYRNDPHASSPETMQMHSGTTSLTLQDDGGLVGDYYTGRGRKTDGRITLRRADG